MTLGNYEIILQKAGFHSIRDKSSGEIMHSVTEPMTESRELYVKQLNPQRELSHSIGSDLVIWDVGLGAATNAMATILECEKLRATSGASRPLHIVSFENDLDSFRLAIRNPSLFPYVQHAAPAALLENFYWESNDHLCRWTLHEGDFRTHIEHAPPPDCIYYDMYSLAANEWLWSAELFSRIFDRCISKRTRLITYSVSTQIRSALLAAGFFVGYGAGTGPKTETTIAFNSLDAVDPQITLLGQEWLSKWERSTAKTSKSANESERLEIEHKVRAHRQFAL
ncbi:MAG TPA: MnmC family methyltransferase [Spirochaetota bacterium]